MTLLAEEDDLHIVPITEDKCRGIFTEQRSQFVLNYWQQLGKHAKAAGKVYLLCVVECQPSWYFQSTGGGGKN